MAQLGRFFHSVIDTAGNAVSGASVTVYRRGATVNGDQSGTSPTAFNVNNPGRIVAADTVIINGGTDSYTVDSVTDTSVTLSGWSGTLSLTDDDRITPTNSKPTLYADAFAGETKSNPLTSSTTGAAECWLGPGFVDAVVSGGSISTVVLPDTLVLGQTDRVNVQWFGALGDGSTNDTTAIQAAIDYAYDRGLSTIYFPPGQYQASQIEWRSQMTLLGSGTTDDPHGMGTRLQQISGSNVDFIVTDTSTGVTGFQHQSMIDNMIIRGNSGDSSGSGIRFNSRPGENTILRRLTVRNFPTAGIRITSAAGPLFIQQIQATNNGTYGIDYDVTGSSTNSRILHIQQISGDDNGTALVRLKTGGGVGTGEAFIISGLKGEKATTGKQNDVLVLDTMQGSCVHVTGVGALNSSAEAANSAIKIVNATCRLFWSSVDTQTSGAGYSYIVDDQVNSITYTGSSSMMGLINGGTLLPFKLGIQAQTNLTISAGAVTISGSSHKVDTSGGASEDLNTISGGVTGQLLVLRALNGSRTVVLKHATGNIQMTGAADFSLDNTNDVALLFYDGTNWLGINGSNNGA